MRRSWMIFTSALCLSPVMSARAATITGTVTNNSGAPLSGVTIKASNGSTATTIGPPSPGTYTLTVSNGWSGYLVASYKPNLAFIPNSPAYRTITNASGTIAGQDFLMRMPSTPAPESLSGTVTLSGGGGLSNVLVYASANGGGDITAANGTYAIGLSPSGPPLTWSGTVKPVKADYTFTPAERSYVAQSIPPGGITNCHFVGMGRVAIPFLPDKRFGGGGGGFGSYSNRVALGIAYERMPVDIKTNYFYNPAGIDFNDADAAVLSAQSNSVRKFGIIAFNGNGIWPPATNLGPVVARYVERYDGDGIDDMPNLTLPVQQWEIFNEYNTNWPGYSGCSETLYALYLSNAYVWAHAACSNITVVASAVPTARGSRPEWYLNKFLANTWVTNYFDAMNYHAYEDYYPFTNGAGVVQNDYLFIRDFKDFLSGYGLANRELWSTETDFCQTYIAGGRTATQADNAIYMARSYPFALACGVDHLFLTEITGSSRFPDHLNWAVSVDSNGTRRAIFYVFQKMTEKLENFTQAQLEEYGDGNLGARFLVGTNPVWVAWNCSNQTDTVQIPVGAYGKVRITDAIPVSFDNVGATWTVATNVVSGGWATVAVSGAAVYVEPFDAVTAIAIIGVAGDHGTLAPASTNVPFGGNASFTIDSDLYYHIASIQTNGGLVTGVGGTSTNFIWRDIRTTGTIHVAFAETLAVSNTPQWWLNVYYPGTNDFDAAALADTDGDGYAAWQEYVAWTVPTSQASRLSVTGLSVGKTNRISFAPAVTERVYTLQANTNGLQSDAWYNIIGQTRQPGTGGTNTLEETGPMNPAFYRIRVELP